MTQNKQACQVDSKWESASPRCAGDVRWVTRRNFDGGNSVISAHIRLSRAVTAGLPFHVDWGIFMSILAPYIDEKIPRGFLRGLVKGSPIWQQVTKGLNP